MDSSPVILDVSSDDDLGWVDDVRFDLIAEFLTEKEESDEVVVLAEIPPRSALRKQNHQQFVKSGDRKAKQNHQNHQNVVANDDDDDDCLILDGDPDKAVAVDNGEAKESDELIVVAEKGQLACRDYPHPRHLCATYPFKTTPHQKHCNLCHCYVCDSIAPCNYWGTGVSNTDHCHATDKEEIWKVRRQSFKQGKTAPPPAPKQLGAALSMAAPRHNSSAVVAPSRPVNHGSLPRSSQSQLNTLRPCSSSSFRVPNIISQRSDRHSGVTPQIISPRNNAVHHVNRSPSSRRTISSTNNVARRRSATVPHFTSPYANFKRAGTSAVTLTKNQTGYSTSFSNSANQTTSLWKNNCSHVTIHGTRNQEFLVGSNSPSTHQSSSQPCMGSSSVGFHPCSDSLQPQICSQPDSLLDRELSVYPRNSCQSSSQPAMGNDSLGFPWIDSPRPELCNQNAYPPGDPHPEIASLNLFGYNWNWFPETDMDAAIPAAENMFQPTSEPPPESNPDPGLPCINDTSTEILRDCWNQPPDLNAGKAAKDAEMDQFLYDFKSHEYDFCDIITFV
ncbi:hypothetical protein Scep_029387 [Stephania cephalantha]|uniref:RPM1 interacting protein 13 n=1 Tax=Stephania cephalantha TaxID=152367 RepID=A0AAP0DXM4_9MAGN